MVPFELGYLVVSRRKGNSEIYDSQRPNVLYEYPARIRVLRNLVLDFFSTWQWFDDEPRLNRRRGDAQSDIDLLIIKETDDSFFNRLTDARRAVAGTHNGVALDLLVLTPQELKERLDKGDQFIRDITETGRLLYAA